jgi:hypothetical protein
MATAQRCGPDPDPQHLSPVAVARFVTHGYLALPVDELGPRFHKELCAAAFESARVRLVTAIGGSVACVHLYRHSVILFIPDPLTYTRCLYF